MGKQTKTSSNNKSKPANNNRRPKPMSPKAGVTKRRSRYENGGAL